LFIELFELELLDRKSELAVFDVVLELVLLPLSAWTAATGIMLRRMATPTAPAALRLMVFMGSLRSKPAPRNRLYAR
jgi:hypothetical protein